MQQKEEGWGGGFYMKLVLQTTCESFWSLGSAFGFSLCHINYCEISLSIHLDLNKPLVVVNQDQEKYMNPLIWTES